jgi:hypothetical protein
MPPSEKPNQRRAGDAKLIHQRKINLLAEQREAPRLDPAMPSLHVRTES